MAEKIHPLPNCGVISLTTPGDPDAVLHSGWAAVLRLAFHDADKPEPERIVFSKEMAREIVAFLRANEQLDEVLVHCDLGISRSAAVALFIRDTFDVLTYRRGVPVDIRYSQYNRLVYRLLSDAYWRDAD
ncbi:MULTISPECIES: dual specificity protein phosphatase family protein [unclassified Variovorax]|nr:MULTISPECIES: dual specificity protein phosphatase family protein [unclassified Variovorax]